MKRILALVTLALATALPAAASHRSYVGCPDLKMAGRVYVTYASHLSCRGAHKYIREVRLRKGSPEGYNCRTWSGPIKRSSGSCRNREDRDKFFGWYPPD